MRKLYVAAAAALVALAVSAVAYAQAPTTFVVPLSSEAEVPGCPAGVESGAGGIAIVQVNAETGEISYRVVAFNLPGAIAGGPGGHIHVGEEGVTGPPVVHFELTGLQTGLVAAGSTTDLTLAAAILANPEDYYVNIHTETCPEGAIRGQLG